MLSIRKCSAVFSENDYKNVKDLQGIGHCCLRTMHFLIVMMT